MKKRNRLVVRNATKADAGTYSCLVAMGTSDMHAKAKLMIKGEVFVFSCIFILQSRKAIKAL